jgi:cytochrome P450
MVTRYQDVVMVLKDSRFSNDPRKREAHGTVRSKVLSLIFARLLNNVLDCDQPGHTRLRGLVHQAFTPKRIEGLRHRIQALTCELLERASTKRNCDVLADHAVPVPMTIIAEMLGAPVRDRERFRK